MHTTAYQLLLSCRVTVSLGGMGCRPAGTTWPHPAALAAGTAVAMRPTQGMLAAAEESPAKAAVAAEVQAVGAFDKVPFSSGSCIFTMDTATDIFIMHSIQVSFSAVVWPMLTVHCTVTRLTLCLDPAQAPF